MQDWLLLFKSIAGFFTIVVVIIAIYHAITLSAIINSDTKNTFFHIDINDSLRAAFGQVLPCILLIYFILDIILIAMRP